MKTYCAALQEAMQTGRSDIGGGVTLYMPMGIKALGLHDAAGNTFDHNDAYCWISKGKYLYQVENANNLKEYLDTHTMQDKMEPAGILHVDFISGKVKRNAQ